MKSYQAISRHLRSPYGAWQMVVMVCTALLVTLYAARPVFNVDLFWHLELGEWIAKHNTIADRDMFSAVHPDSPWVQFQWLWELLAYIVVSCGGITLLRVSQTILLVATFAALFYAVHKYTKDAFVSTFLMIFGLLLYEERFQARPDALNLLFLTFIWSKIVNASRSGTLRTALVVFVVSALWSNLHAGSAVLGTISFGAVAVGRTIQKWIFRTPDSQFLHKNHVLWLFLFSSTAGLLANPTFLSGWAHFIEIYPSMRATGNWEWEPTYRMIVNGSSPYFFFLSFAPSLSAIFYVGDLTFRLFRREWRQIDWGEVVLCIGFLVLAHQASRNAVLALFPTIFALNRALGRVIAQKYSSALLAAAVALLAVSYSYRVHEVRGGIGQALHMVTYDLEPSAYPEELGDFLAEAEIEGKILNYGKWGGYLIWVAWPRCTVFVDTRHHLSPEMWKVFYASHTPAKRPTATIFAANQWEIDLLVFPGPTFPLQQPPPGWELLFKAGPQELYLRSDSPNAAQNRERALKWADARDTQSPIGSTILAAAARRWLAHPYNQERLTAAYATLEIDSNGKAARTIGSILAQSGAYKESRRFLEESAQKSPENLRTWYWLALVGWHTRDSSLLSQSIMKLKDLPTNKLAPIEQMELSMLADYVKKSASMAP